MKKFLSCLVLVLALLGLVACGDCPECPECPEGPECPEVKTSVEGLTLSGQKIEFKVGETFEVGELVVKATLSDDSVVEVANDKYTVEQSADMNVPGTYAVLVKYENQVAAYQIKVVEEVVEEYATINAALEAGVANKDKVAKGVVVNNLGETEYGFGNGFTYLVNGTDELYYQELEDGSVFGVNVYADFFTGEPVATYVYEPSVDMLKGADFSSVFGYEKNVYGTEDLVNELYAMANAETSFNFVEEIVKCSDCGSNLTYNFSFDAIINGYYELVSVVFALDNEAEFISEVVVSIEGYYEENYSLNEETNEYQINEGVYGADFISQVVVAQEAGEKLAENPHGPEKYVYESFDLTKEEVVVEEGASFDVTVGESVELNVSNVQPEAVVPGVDMINVSITDAEGNETWLVSGSCYDGVVSVTAYGPGVYNVTVASTKVSKTFKLNVASAQLVSFAAGVVNQFYEVEEKSEVTVYVNSEVLVAPVVNAYANDAFTAELKEETDNATVVEADEYYAFTATVPGTYEVVLKSAENTDFSAVLTVVVEEAPSLGGLLSGTYKLESVMLGTATAIFTPESEGAEKGTLEISLAGGYVEASGNFTYEVSGGVLVVTPADAGSAMSGLSVELDPDFNVCLLYNAFNQGIMIKEGGSSEGVEGLYIAYIIHPMTGMQIEYRLTLNADGTATYDFSGSWYYGTCNYEVSEGTIVFSNFNAMLGTNPISLNDVFFAEGKISCTFVCEEDGTNTALEFTK